MEEKQHEPLEIDLDLIGNPDAIKESLETTIKFLTLTKSKKIKLSLKLREVP